MPIWLLVILGVVWLAWVVQGVLSWMLAAKFAVVMKRPPRKYETAYEPPVNLIVPFKGLEPSLRANLESLCTQAYPAYRLVCVVESDDDPAAAIIREVLSNVERPPGQFSGECLVAGLASDHEGQKVHNLLAALEHLEPMDEQSVLVFADSDAVPDSRWLGQLVLGLYRFDRTAVSTGYRWLIPTAREGGGHPTFWAHVASVLNSSAASFYAEPKYRHAWGGSMAIRVETARRGDLVGRWRGALSDDYSVTKLAYDLGMTINFVPQCLVASPVDHRLSEFFNFARRQYLITRTYMPRLIVGACLFQCVYLAGLLSGWAVLIGSLVTGGRWLAFFLAFVTLGIVFGCNQMRAAARRRSVERAFGPQVLSDLRTTLRIDRWLTPVWTTIHLGIILSALVGRTFRWRGTRYRLAGPQSVERLNRG